MNFVFAVMILVGSFLGIVFISGGNVMFMVDVPSFLGLVLFTVPVFAASGYARDFAKGLKIILKKESGDFAQLKKSAASVSFLIKAMFLSSAVISLIGVMCMLGNLIDWSHFGQNLAVAVLSFCYSFVITLVLLPLKGILERKMIDSVNV